MEKNNTDNLGNKVKKSPKLSVSKISQQHNAINEIMDIKKEILLKTAKEYFYSGEDELKKERFNSAVVLFFKSLISLVDLYLFEKTGNTPSSHGARFRITQNNFNEVYDILDKDFPFYQDSYVQVMTKELAEVIKNDAELMAEKTKIKL